MKVFIFDLDDTLINHRLRVPRQTRHFLEQLQRLGYQIGIISYNPMIHFACATAKLFQYTSHVFYGDCNRDILFKRCLESFEENGEVYYADDREDNLQIVKNAYPHVTTFHCDSVYTLYRIKNLLPKNNKE